MRILCTGGAGYVGSACLRYLLAQGHDVFAYDNLSAGKRAAVPDAATRLIEGDLADAAALESAMREHAIEGVMHFAAVASVPDSIKDPASYWKHNVVGTKNVLDAMLANGIKRLVFSSTAATYEFSEEMPLTEASPQVPVTPYGSTKLACERMIEEYRHAYGLGYTIFRYFNASGADPDGEYGEDRDSESHLIPLVLYAVVGRRDNVLVFGKDWATRDGTCVRDYVHVADIAQAHSLAIEAQQEGQGHHYNIGSSQGTTVLEVIQACEAVHGGEVPYEFAPPRPGDPAILIASADALRRDLGWAPKLDGIKAIVETAHRWHTRYPNGYADTGR